PWPWFRSRRPRSGRARLPTPRRRPADGVGSALLRRVHPRRGGPGSRRPAGDRPLAAPSRDPCDAGRPPGCRPFFRPPHPGPIGMTTRYDFDADFDRAMRQWLDDDARVRAPEHLLGSVLDETRHARRIPGWLLPERWISMQLALRAPVVPRLVPLL